MSNSNSNPTDKTLTDKTDKTVSDKQDELPEEEDVGYQRRIKIKMPAGVKEGDDPFVDPGSLLPIDDSFGQVIVPLNPEGLLVPGPSLDVLVQPTAPESGPDNQLSPMPVVDVPPNFDLKSPMIPMTPAPADPSASPALSNTPATIPSQVPSIPNQPASVMGGTGNSVMQKDVAEAGISVTDYYHGLLPREDITRMLAQNGDFLLRSTEIAHGMAKNRQMCLSVKWNDAVQHFLLQPQPTGMYALNDNPQQSFPTMLELVNFHLRSGVPFGPAQIVIMNPICRQDWEFRQDQIRLIRQIGSGAFGQVFHGFAIPQGAPCAIEVAVKTLKCSILNKEKIEEIMKEARMMRLLRHRNVVRCYGVSADSEPLMILMEFVPGSALDSYLRKENVNIGIPERLDMTLGAAKGLEHVHQRGILHRDVAARNCLYGRKLVKLSDFGLSRQCPTFQMEPTEKAPLRWLAPEVFRAQICSFASDVWAYGVLVWEIFTNGEEPYAGWNGPKIKDEVMNRKYRLYAPEWAPQIVKDILVQCFIEDPGKRISISAIVQMLKLATKDNGKPPQPVAAPPLVLVQPAQRSVAPTSKFVAGTGPVLTTQMLFPQSRLAPTSRLQRPAQKLVQRPNQLKPLPSQQLKPVVFVPVRGNSSKKKNTVNGVSREFGAQNRDIKAASRESIPGNVSRLGPPQSRKPPITTSTNLPVVTTDQLRRKETGKQSKAADSRAAASSSAKKHPKK